MISIPADSDNVKIYRLYIRLNGIVTSQSGIMFGVNLSAADFSIFRHYNASPY